MSLHSQLGFCPVEGVNTVSHSPLGPVDIFLLNVPQNSLLVISVLNQAVRRLLG